MKHTSLFVKLYVSFIAFLVIPVIVLGVVFSSGIIRTFRQEVADSSLSRIRSVRDAADEFLDQVRRTTLDGLNEVGGTIISTDVDHLFAVLGVLRLLSGARTARSQIHSAYLYGEQVDTIFKSGNEIQPGRVFRDTSWMETQLASLRTPFWRGPRVPIGQGKTATGSAVYTGEYDARSVVTLVWPLSTYASMSDDHERWSLNTNGRWIGSKKYPRGAPELTREVDR